MFKVVGKRRTEFTPKDSDNVISGYNLYVTFDDDKIEGTGTDRIFVSDSKFLGDVPNIGDQIDVRYNRYGKVDYVEVLL